MEQIAALIKDMRTVVLYGNSLVVSSVGASLQRDSGLEVLPIDVSSPGAAARLEGLHPDVVIFDLATVRPELNISLWKAHPNVLLIGMDLARDEVLVLSGQPATARSPKELRELVNGPKRGLAEPPNVRTSS